MLQYLLAFAVAAVLTELLSHVIIGWANRKKFFIPALRERDLHQKPVPRVGGIAIVIAFIVVTLGLYFIHPASLTFTHTKFMGIDRNLFGFILAVVILSAVNIMDDFRSVSVALRLTTQIIASLVVVYFGIKLNWLTNPFGGHLAMGDLSVLFVVLWLVGLSNVTNWLDGMNGLADGVGLIALVVLFILSIEPRVHQPAGAMLAVIGAGSLMGFLPFNIVKAKAFLGDAGSIFIGFLVGVLAIISGGKIATAFLVLAIPLLDALVVIFTRLFHGKSPFQADKSHLHHRLLEFGFKPWQIIGMFYSITILFGLIALNTRTIGKTNAIIASVVLMLVLVALYSFKKPNATAKQN